jgi:hypothetical protein
MTGLLMEGIEDGVGFNMYICGSPGLGKTMRVNAVLKDIEAQEETRAQLLAAHRPLHPPPLPHRRFLKLPMPPSPLLGMRSSASRALPCISRISTKRSLVA